MKRRGTGAHPSVSPLLIRSGNRTRPSIRSNLVGFPIPLSGNSSALQEAVDHAPVAACPLAGLVQLSLFSIIAVPICLLLGLPLWHCAMRSGRQRRGDALRFGLIAGGLIGAVMAIIGDPGTRWFDEPLDFLGYCLAGLCAGGVTYRLGYRRP
ncbi:hypothetical protein ASE73_03495 [Sphingomonas sp. Leaf24]|nr:hypothetical protein ASE73_03495 [Sphingomonas sp. Leaf24]